LEIVKIPHFHPVIIAGGSGTRFWPLSRKSKPKQALALNGKQTMVQQAVSRLMPLASNSKFFVITGEVMAPVIRRQLKSLKPRQIIAEPAARNTAPAIGLAAHILLRQDPDAVIGIFPADHTIADKKIFHAAIQRAVRVAQTGDHVVVFGIPPDRPDTGYGYIEHGKAIEPGIFRVRRFTEKPDVGTAQQFLKAGTYAWNGGMFFWTARTLVKALYEHLPETSALLAKIAAAHGTAKFARVFKQLYPKCQNISIDYAVMEPRSRAGEDASKIFSIHADFGWNDLGTWDALHQHRKTIGVADADGNVLVAAGSYTLESHGNFVHAPGKFVSVVGVDDLVVVETADALLITTRSRSQDVGKIVQHLSAKKKIKLV
jgi:mannose-1-phosphate guanylyltransferase